MKNTIELLAPGGDVDAIKAAIAAGADAVYCGLNTFNARNRAANIEFEELYGIIHLAHTHRCKVFLTLNILIMGSEIPCLTGLLNRLTNTQIDGVIVQDLGLFYLLSTYFKGLEIHASTQMNTHNEGQVSFLSVLGAKRVNLSRELNLDEISALTRFGHAHDMATEVFVHGSYCISFSGLCYMSSVLGGRSGNRGRCSQPCRDRYATTPAGKHFPFNLKDNSAYFDLPDILAAKVDAIKIEGRIKKFDYVYTVVNCWRKHLDEFYAQNRLNPDNSDLYKTFNRDFSNAYLTGKIHKDMFIDNPRDYSVGHIREINRYLASQAGKQGPVDLYAEKEKISTVARQKITQLSIARSPLSISVSGKKNARLTLGVRTPDHSFFVHSKGHLAVKNKKSTARDLDDALLSDRLGSLGDTPYYIDHLGSDHLDKDLFLSFKELSCLKKEMVFVLNGSKKQQDPVKVPFLKKPDPEKLQPELAVLISSKKDVCLGDKTDARLFFQLPNCLAHERAERIDFFLNHRHLIPWFPSVLIKEHYTAAIEFLERVQPKQMVTDNTGIAYYAFKKGLSWIAGPCLNLVNSYGFLCVKERFNCSGAFVSNEISRRQIKGIIRPDGFKLYYSLYHPILLFSSRQCLFHQVVGCTKHSMDENCLELCERSASIIDGNNRTLFIKKARGNYPCVYSDKNFLNTDIVSDIRGVFSSFLIDLKPINTQTRIKTDAKGMIRLFNGLLNGDPGSENRLVQQICPSSCAQYKKGI